MSRTQSLMQHPRSNEFKFPTKKNFYKYRNSNPERVIPEVGDFILGLDFNKKLITEYRVTFSKYLRVVAKKIGDMSHIIILQAPSLDSGIILPYTDTLAPATIFFLPDTLDAIQLLIAKNGSKGYEEIHR